MKLDYKDNNEVTAYTGASKPRAHDKNAERGLGMTASREHCQTATEGNGRHNGGVLEGQCLSAPCKAGTTASAHPAAYGEPTSRERYPWP